MRNLLKISDAAVLGIHALGTLTGAEEPVSASRMAAALGVSEAHLSKVLQRLVRAGLVSSSRGPRGGFLLATDPGRVTLLKVFEAVDGPIEEEGCLLGGPVCRISAACPARALADDVRELVVSRLQRLTLHDIDLSELITES